MKEDDVTPPQWGRNVLMWFLRDDLAEEVEGDLEEKFYSTLKAKSLFRARLHYWYQVLNYLRPFALRKKKSVHFNQWDMFENYFKIASRNLLKQKLYSSINIGGLTLGLTCFIVILLFVQHEFSYDRFYPNVDRIYRVYQRQEGNVFLGTDYFGVTPAKLAPVMMEECPEVAFATTVQRTSGLLTTGDTHLWQEGIAADAQFFNVFHIPVVSGNPKTALTDAQSVILTKSLAKTFFGDDDPLGKAFRYQNGEKDYIVTAIVEDPPANSSIKYAFIIHILYNNGYAEEIKRAGWDNNSYYTFFELKQGALVTSLEEKFKRLLKKYQLPEDYKEYPFKDQYFAQQLTAAYFQSDVNFDLGQRGNLKVIYAYAAVALIVLLLACVNYMNLAIARSVKRAREVGLRKVVGAMRNQLIGQFLGESIFIAFFSLVLAVALTYTILPYFGNIVERPIEFSLLSNPWLIPGLLTLVLLVGFLSGSYPAFSISSLKPVDVLKTKLDAKLSSFSLQRFLIVFQFAASIIFIIGSLVIYKQLNFMKEKELGYTKEDVVTILLKDRSLIKKFPELAHQWMQHSNVSAVAMSSHLPIDISSSTMIRKNPDDLDKLAIYQWTVENGFLDVFGIKMIAGRNFPKNNTAGEETFIINETAARMLGWTAQEAVDKQIYYGDGAKTIIGVVNDFHMLSMHLPIQPLLIRYSDTYGRFVSLKVNHKDVQQTLAFIEQTFKKNSVYPFEYEFLSDKYDDLYNSELRLSEVFGFFTMVSIAIAALGLFGLAAFMAGQRTREIGIRKVLGGSVSGIVVLLSKDFLVLVVVAFVLAAPIGWYLMSEWLQDFAYRITIDWWVFAIAGILALAIAKLSIGYQSLKASMANPVDSLRSE